MKECALNIMKQHATGSVESMHMVAFIAMSAGTDDMATFMVNALKSDLSDEEMREYVEYHGLHTPKEVYIEMANDYINHQLALVEVSCKVGVSII